MFQHTIEFYEALKARDRVIASHFFDKNVTLVDIGWRIKESELKRITKELAVRVHLRYKPRGEMFERFAAAYPQRIIREDSIGFPIDIIEATYPTQLDFWWSRRRRSARTMTHRPLLGGISISNELSFGYGTLGGVVRDRTSGRPMILSNWHVLAGTVYAQPGLRILQPGFGDGGRFGNAVAELSRNALHKGIDAAVAELDSGRRISTEQFEAGEIVGLTSPEPDMLVMKSGRTSEITDGIITGVAGLKKILIGGFQRTIRHTVHIAQTGGGQVSAPGDSGSWWLERNSRLAVALHFAGSNQPEYGLGIAMPEVINALNVDIIT